MNKYIFVLSTLIITLFAAVPSASARVIVQEKGSVTISEDEVIADDLFVGAESVSIYGTVEGDVYVGSGSVRVEGKVGGDLVAGTGNLILSGAEIGDSIIVGAGQVTIDGDTTIGGSLIAGAGTVHNQAPVGRNVMVGGGEVYLDSTIGGEVRVGAGTLTLGPRASVARDLTYSLGEESSIFTMSESATVGGIVNRFEPPRNWQQNKPDFKKIGVGLYAGWTLFSYLGALVVGLLALRLLPKSSKLVTEHAAKHTLASLGIGFLALIIAFPAFVIMFMTGLGAPLALILLALFLVALYLGKLVTASIVGGWLARQFGKKWGVYVVFFAGLTAFALIRLVPFVGGLACFVATLIGLGALITYSRSLAGR